jgi:hypothetical protein
VDQLSDGAWPKGRDGKPNLAAPAPRAVDGKSDLSGVWQTRVVPGVEAVTEPVAGSSIFPAEFARQTFAPSPAGKCRPTGILQRLTNIVPKKFVQRPACSSSCSRKTTSSGRSSRTGAPRPSIHCPRSTVIRRVNGSAIRWL